MGNVMRKTETENLTSYIMNTGTYYVLLNTDETIENNYSLQVRKYFEVIGKLLTLTRFCPFLTAYLSPVDMH